MFNGVTSAPNRSYEERTEVDVFSSPLLLLNTPVGGRAWLAHHFFSIFGFNRFSLSFT